MAVKQPTKAELLARIRELEEKVEKQEKGATLFPNKVTFGGRLGRNAKVFTTKSGTPMCSLRLLNQKPNGSPVITEVLVFGDKVKQIEKLGPGSQVVISGKIDTRDVRDQDGKWIERRTTIIVGEETGEVTVNSAKPLSMLKKHGGPGKAEEMPLVNTGAEVPEPVGAIDDDIPF